MPIWSITRTASKKINDVVNRLIQEFELISYETCGFNLIFYLHAD
jgi:hypothetical protein